MTQIQRRDLLAHYFALHFSVGFVVVPVVEIISEPWTYWNIVFLFACWTLAPICHFKSLPYMRWFAVKALELSEKLARIK